ncbi:LytR family transcriptional regulator [Aeromicrobium camelliae]|uniref:LytR family transcriptional regulator n=1 Tax=Aeromicrobium camelliae TaxID=1538144 RepID=A0A3N6YET3_9ACTN|nr:LCP family protein [Aeromicrobium camelliae]RQN08324.1 LytR family transcriptional regulator [Aeromicrobium camelliae]
MSNVRYSVMGGSYGDPAGASARIQFRRALTLALMTLVMPGSAQLVHGNRAVGRIAVRVWLGVLGLIALLVLVSLTSRSMLFEIGTNGTVLTLGRWLLIAGAVAWAALLVDAWRLGRPREMRRGHFALSAGLNGVLCFAVAGAMFFAAHAVSVMDGFAGAVFASTSSSGPHEGRYNILLLGSDSGDDREGMRPDSINVASIDADTGRAVLIGLPRNLEDVPFPEGSVMDKEFPDGFDCEGCYLNAVNTWAEDHADLFGEEDPGIDATMDAVEEITGLKLNYYALVDMAGFEHLIDAVGGVTVNVRERTAIDGIGSPISGYIEPGERTLSGYEALWYARSRVENDDWSRMGRQKCVLNAMVQQLSPQKVVMNMQKIADSSQAMIHTNIPRQDLNVFMDLALKTRNEPVSSVSLVPPEIYTGNPDYDKVRRMVSDAIAVAEGRPEATAVMVSSSLGMADPNPAVKDPRKANHAENLDETC